MEGCEAILAGADALLARCAVHGTRRVEVGMAHRGRLAMLSTLLNKPPGTLFAKMENAQSDYAVGDVTYHLGETATLTYAQVHSPPSAEYTVVKTLQCARRWFQQARFHDAMRAASLLFPDGNSVVARGCPHTHVPACPKGSPDSGCGSWAVCPCHSAAHAERGVQGAQARDIRVSIAPNPSHLEAVGPVVQGLVRALQQRLGASGQQRVLGLLVHGDAAFSGLGIVPECLQLSTAPGDP